MRIYLIVAILGAIPALGAEALLIGKGSGITKPLRGKRSLMYILSLGILVAGPVIILEFFYNLKPPYVFSLLLLIALPVGKIFSIIKKGSKTSEAPKVSGESSEEQIRSILNKKGLEDLAKEERSSEN